MDNTEEALNRQLENLERLMVSLDISGKSQETYDDKSEDNNQIIYDFSSEEEANENEIENPHYVKIEDLQILKENSPNKNSRKYLIIMYLRKIHSKDKEF
ncbi:hypothetical protein QL285_083556 [Trifolium repens]|nr:hypothetical protein QL285_083556 [Trifolium repens]